MDDAYTLADVETAVRLMAGLPVSRTAIDPAGGLQRLTCCGVPPGRNPGHAWTRCLASRLAQSDNSYESGVAQQLFQWEEEQTEEQAWEDYRKD